jgi:meso-butanediol dehydrogenase / (S,S)-butanediol dehydrogenase / diacetyl reductase
MEKFSNKVVVITAAASEIGRALTSRFLEEGAYVVAVDASQDILDQLSEDLEAYEELFTAVADISSEESMQQLHRKI